MISRFFDVDPTAVASLRRMRTRTVLLVIPNLTNPMALVWAAGISQAGYELILYDLSAPDPPGEDVMRTADVLVHWWGIESMSRLPPTIVRVARQVPVVLCVDTFPNAAFAHSARRELRTADSSVIQPTGLICYSQEMADAVQHAIPRWRSLPTIAIAMPMLDQLLCRCPTCGAGGGPDQSLPGAAGVVFQGRADLLFARDPRMSKDRLGPLLTRIAANGVPVTVQAGSNIQGLAEYRRHSADEMLNGVFSTFLAQFDGQLAVYRETNRTIRRRVALGLSTRFAFGLASCSPILVSRTATFALGGAFRSFVLPVRPDLKDVGDVLANRDRLAQAREAHRAYLAAERWSVRSEDLQTVLGQ